MKFLVQKFGGTSVATREKRNQVVEHIAQASQAGYSLVVVVSAMGRQGEPYATDSLLALASQGGGSNSPQELDQLLSCGEIISGTLLTNTLNGAGYKAVFLTGGQAGIITDEEFGNARIVKVQPGELVKLAREGYIVVVAGFQGLSEKGCVTTLGRGGSDTTAAALGVALNAEFIDIFTDVEGIMTADPRIVENARVLETVTYNEICQLAHQGAKVIHPRAVEIAQQKNIPLRVRSTFSQSPGTLVTSNGGAIEATGIRGYELITGITQIPNVTQLKVAIQDSSEHNDLALRIFKGMALADISVDFINVHPDSVIYTVPDAVATRAVEILHNLGMKPETKPGCAKVATVGAGMTGIPGVMASIVEALAKENIQILQAADSHTTIWVLVQRKDMETAVRALHAQFNLGR